MEINNCPAANTFNVFGLDDKLCCYKYHKYCNDVEECILKSIIKQKEDEWLNKELGVQWH